MVDIHCHILPRFDDGASSLEEAIAMARMAAASGVTDIVATPHFPGRADSLRHLPRVVERYQTLAKAIAQAGIPVRLHPGAEILCTAETVDLAAQRKLPTIGRTNYFLTEFYFDERYDFMDEMLDSLAESGFIPVVAHPERYEAIQRDPLVLERWFRRGYVLQINKGSPLGSFGSRVQRAAHTILEAGLAHVIASDAHSSAHRTPHMGPLLRWMDAYMDPEYARILTEENPSRLIRGEKMVPVE